jgi:hypothetical protein
MRQEQVIFARRIGRGLLLELQGWHLVILSIIVGVLWAASLFDWDFVIGRDAFWEFPRGTIGGADYDMAQVLTGYFYYVQSPWHLLLFYVSALGAPAGVNAIFTDFVPIVALVGKLIHSLTGAKANLYGAYLFLCFVLPGVMMTLVLIAAKIRYALAAIIGAVFANAAPILLWRWGHIALMAQFLLIGALALYLFSLNKRPWRGVTMAWIAYLSLAYLMDIYIFTMVGIVWFCAAVQRRFEGLGTTRHLLQSLMLTLVSVSALVAFSQLGGQYQLPFTPGFGIFSMNLLSPFLPQKSGLFSRWGQVIDATGGQYEGFNYFGIGLLVASLLVLSAELAWLKRELRRHVALIVALLAVTAFAISDRVFLGHRLVFELPITHYVSWVLGIYPGSGRFFWLVYYAQMALVIILGFRRQSPVIAVCLLAAAVVQLFDVQPLRAQISASIAAGSGTEELDPGQVARVIAKAHLVEVVPSFHCSDSNKELTRANAQLMLAAARANIPTNTVNLSHYSYGITIADILRAPSLFGDMLTTRHDDYCKQELERARTGGRPGEVLVLLSNKPRPEEMAPGITCVPLSWARYCEGSERSGAS